MTDSQNEWPGSGDWVNHNRGKVFFQKSSLSANNQPTALLLNPRHILCRYEVTAVTGEFLFVMKAQSPKAPNAMDIAVGARLKLARKEKGFTQQDLAIQLGMSFQQVQKYEKGMNRISAGTLFDVSVALNKPISWFYDDADWEILDEPNSVYSECCALLLELKSTDKLELVRDFLKMATKS